MQREDKLTMNCSSVELAGVFRDVAEALERGRISLDTLDVAWDEVAKITLSIKNRAGAADLKLKIASGLPKRDPSGTKSQDSSLPPVSKSKPRSGYGALKKRMKKSFKNILYSLHDTAWPSPEDVSSFVRDSALMVGYAGKGDEFYPAYSEAVAAFEAAVQSQDLALATQKAHLLNEIKTGCHKLYD